MSLSTLTLALLPLVANANDGWSKGTGTPYDFENPHTTIQLVREHAHFDIGDDDAFVSVDFWFKNHGPATTVTMAFPEQADKRWVAQIEDFQSTVDDRPVPVRRKVLLEDEDTFEFKAVYLKEVTFEEGQTRHVKVTYKQVKGGTVYGWNSFYYTFRTALTWKGTIEELRITCDWSRIRGVSRPDIKLTSYTGQGSEPTYRHPIVTGKRSAKFVLKDVRPDFDFDALSQTGFLNVEINGEWVSPERLSFRTKGHPSDLSRARSRDDLRVTVGSVPDLFPQFDFGLGNHRPAKLVAAIRRVVPGATLARPPEADTLWETAGPDVYFVYLRDVVEALGGTYRYDPKHEKVFITVPKAPASTSAKMYRQPSFPQLGTEIYVGT